jgi:hypothetical protein
MYLPRNVRAGRYRVRVFIFLLFILFYFILFIYLFIFRTVLFEYLDDMRVNGVAGYRYEMSKNFGGNGTSGPGTVCKSEEHSLPRGVVNLTACRHGAPAFISSPHFFNADPYYVSQVAGLQPEADKHQFYITLEPVSKIKKQDRQCTCSFRVTIVAVENQ